MTDSKWTYRVVVIGLQDAVTNLPGSLLLLLYSLSFLSLKVAVLESWIVTIKIMNCATRLTNVSGVQYFITVALKK